VVKLCKDCKYLKNDMWCKGEHLPISLVDGDKVSVFAFVERRATITKLMEDDRVTCGPDGTFWKPKATKDNSLYKKVLFMCATLFNRD